MHYGNSILYIIISFYFALINTKFERLSLKTLENYYYIRVYIGSYRKELLMRIDSSIPFPLISSPSCKKCISDNFNPSYSKTCSLKQENTFYPKYYINFTGNQFIDEFKFSSSSESPKFTSQYLSIINFTIIYNFTFPGYFPLSFCNQNFTKSIGNLGLIMRDYKYYLDIDVLGTDSVVKFNKSLFSNFTVVKDKDEQIWYLECENLTLGNKTDNITINSTETFKIAVDTQIWSIQIPKKFFFEHIKHLLPSNSECQLLRNGNFKCKCNEHYEDTFKEFYFTFTNGDILPIRVTDYLSYKSLFAKDDCILDLNINYNSDYWVIGISVLNNFYTVFDYNNSKLILHPYDKIEENRLSSSHFMLIFWLVGGLSIFILFGGHYLYKKCVLDREQ